MAFESPITSWAISNKDALELVITRFTATEEWLPGYFDFRVQMKVNGKLFFGSGFAEDPRLAVEKAISEAIERAVCNSYGIRSNGVACHTDSHKARSNAIDELIERDTFLRHYLLKVPGERLPLQPQHCELSQKLAKHSLALKLYKLTCADDKIIVLYLCHGKGPKEPFIFGLGCSKDENSSTTKALGECLKNTLSFIEGTLPTAISISEFNNSRLNVPLDRIRLFTHQDAISASEFWLKESDELNFTQSNWPSSQECLTSELQIKTPCLRSAPVRIFRATHSMAITPERLEEDSNLNQILIAKKLNVDQLNLFPHPVG